MSLRTLELRTLRVSLLLLGGAVSGCSGSVTTPEHDPSGDGDGPARAGSSASSATGGAAGSARRSPIMNATGATEVSDVGLAMSTGRGGSGGSSSGVDEEVYCDAVSQVFMPRCGGGSCHSNPNATIGDFAVGTAEAESYVNVPSVRNPVCGLIIDPVAPSNSLILRKVVGGFPSPTCGGAMPVTGGELTDDQIDCVASWVRKFRSSD